MTYFVVAETVAKCIQNVYIPFNILLSILVGFKHFAYKYLYMNSTVQTVWYESSEYVTEKYTFLFISDLPLFPITRINFNPLSLHGYIIPSIIQERR